MPRYSQRRLFNSFSPGANFQTITELSIEREWDEGELLIHASLSVREDSAANAAELEAYARIDSEPDPFTFAPITGVPISTKQNLSWTIIRPITAGKHTIAIRARNPGLGIATLLPDACLLTVVQLPLWDTAGDVEIP